MSAQSENELLKMVIETQASRIKDQEETIKELRTMIDELRSLKANLEETLSEFRRQFFGVKSFKKGEVPSAFIPHSPASAYAVAFVMLSKCFMGLPYYRQESAFTQLGAKIPRETLANWCIIAAENYLFPIYDLIHRELIRREVIHADETTCQVLREEGKEAQSTSYMWIYTSGTDGLPKIVLYEYQPGRGGIHPGIFRRIPWITPVRWISRL